MVNLRRILGLDELKGDERFKRLEEIGVLLFPTAAHPTLAMKRVLREDRALDTDQVTRLASYLNVSPSIFFSSEKWRTATKEGVHYFENGDYRAELDTSTWTTKVFHKDTLFHDKVIHNGSITLSNYLREIDLIIEFNESRGHTQRLRNTK